MKKYIIISLIGVIAAAGLIANTTSSIKQEDTEEPFVYFSDIEKREVYTHCTKCGIGVYFNHEHEFGRRCSWCNVKESK